MISPGISGVWAGCAEFGTLASHTQEAKRGRAMDIDDLEPRKPKPQAKNLEPMSIAELNDYIGELEAEIARVRADIAKKAAHRAGVEGLFKKK